VYFLIKGCDVDVRNGDQSLQLEIFLDVVGGYPIACLEVRQLIFLTMRVI
jgi:hypothetical protein